MSVIIFNDLQRSSPVTGSESSKLACFVRPRASGSFVPGLVHMESWLLESINKWVDRLAFFVMAFINLRHI